ncbi:hypothetical protein JW926_02530 [Candidatus Sumerlaeota bacterium]|nr:hypothetical protein [Candidatus Sumerlaeota bacterium]
MKEPVFKHTPYYEVLEALQKAKRCPLCEMRDRSNHRYFENLLYENVNDPVIRKNLIRSGGFCARHARILLGFGDGLGVSILYQDQLKLILSMLKDVRSKCLSSLRRKVSSYIKSLDTCPACSQENKNDECRLHTLLNGIGETEMKDAFEKSPGLCLFHLLQSLTFNKNADTRQYLISLHEGKYSGLLSELQEFIRKHDYRYSDKKMGKESDSWLRAVEMFCMNHSEL